MPDLGERLLVTGGRNYADRSFAFRTFDELHAVAPIALMIHGKCPTGLDAFAADWANSRGVPQDPYPAAWDDIDAVGAVIRMNQRGRPYNVRAGFQRNEKMVRRSCPTRAIAFRGNNGTDDCVAHILRAIRAGQQIEFTDLRKHL